MSIEKEVITRLDFKGKEKENAERITKAVLDLIPQEAMECFSKDQFIKRDIKFSLINTLKRFKKSSLRNDSVIDELIDLIAFSLTDTLLSIAYTDKDIEEMFNEMILKNPRKWVRIASIFATGHAKLYPYKYQPRSPNAYALAYVATNYENLENLEERLKEGKECAELYEFYRKTELFPDQFEFFIERAYGIKIETFNGEELSNIIINIRNAKEINKVISLDDIKYYRDRGAEIYEALVKKSTVIKFALSPIHYSQAVLLLGTFSKEEFLQTFEKNLMDLIKRVEPAFNIKDILGEETPFKRIRAREAIVRGAFNRTLYGQKDHFTCSEENYEYLRPFKPIFYETIFGAFTIHNGYEDLATYFLSSLPYIPREVYFERYKDDRSKLLNLKLVSLLYKFTKDLDDDANINEEILHQFLDNAEKAIEKNNENTLSKVMEVFR